MTARSLLRSVSFAGDTACGLPQACTSARTVCRTTRLRFLTTAAACAERTARTVCTMRSAIGNPMSAGQGTGRFRPSRHPPENWVSLPASSFGFRRLPPSRRRAAPRRCSFRRLGAGREQAAALAHPAVRASHRERPDRARRRPVCARKICRAQHGVSARRHRAR